MSETSSRLQWVDTAKGLSILLVVMMHSAIGVGEETGGTGYLHWIIAWASPFRMPEFFAISGLFLSLVIARDWRRYTDRRVVHYLYFYAVWAVIQIVFKVALGTGDPVKAAGDIAWAVVEPYGVLWFIYMLAVFSAVAKLLHDIKAPHYAVLGIAAVLQMASIHLGSHITDQFAEYFVYFYAGYALAPHLFKLVAWAEEHWAIATAGILAWIVLETALVFSPGFAVTPGAVNGGLSMLPGVHLLLALLGVIALCVLSALLAKLPFMDWLRWLGSRSIIVYLAFALPMAVSRTVLLKLGIITDTGLLSTIVMAIAVISPLILYWLIQLTGWGKFLFERPAWAHLPGTPGAREPRKAPAQTPAE
jgi:uncharacterized membrane protein YcfT